MLVGGVERIMRKRKTLERRSWGKLCQGPQLSWSFPISFSVGSKQDNDSSKDNDSFPGVSPCEPG